MANLQLKWVGNSKTRKHVQIER